MDISDQLELAIRDVLLDQGLPNVFAWGEDRSGIEDTQKEEHHVKVVQIGQDHVGRSRMEVEVKSVRYNINGRGVTEALCTPIELKTRLAEQDFKITNIDYSQGFHSKEVEQNQRVKTQTFHIDLVPCKNV